MKTKNKVSALFVILALAGNTPIFSQDNAADPDQPPAPRKSKFHSGFFVGSYFANKYTASTYNGYGFDLNGNRNTFINSVMYQKIINEYGGGYGQADQIAQALGVDPHQWAFSESDMPVNMHYVPAIMVGFNFRAPVNKKSAIIFNINGTKLSIEGNFTLSTFKPQTQPQNPATNPNLNTFAIKGKEQRLIFQMGYQQIFGDDEKLNFFGEIGFVGTLTKFDRNWIYINNLQIDLSYYANYSNQGSYSVLIPTKAPIGFGIGAFAGFGLNLNINPKFTIQLLYSPSQERVKIGSAPTLKLQNAVGMRVYYNL